LQRRGSAPRFSGKGCGPWEHGRCLPWLPPQPSGTQKGHERQMGQTNRHVSRGPARALTHL
jgi:hypothetical protein